MSKAFSVGDVVEVGPARHGPDKWTGKLYTITKLRGDYAELDDDVEIFTGRLTLATPRKGIHIAPESIRKEAVAVKQSARTQEVLTACNAVLSMLRDGVDADAIIASKHYLRVAGENLRLLGASYK